MIKARSVYIVGNHFSNFAQYDNVYTFYEFLSKIYSGDASHLLSENLEVVLGQGLSEEERQVLDLLLAKHGARVFSGVSKELASSRITHKHQSKNILISTPSQLDGHHYSSELYIDDACAEMSDHVTGQHVQGMVLVEAARQMTLAVTEEYYLDANHQCGFVTNELATNFHQYLFPSPAQLFYQVLSCRKGLGDNAKFKVKIDFIQNEVVCAEVFYTFSTFDKNFLHMQERKMAQSVIGDARRVELMRVA